MANIFEDLGLTQQHFENIDAMKKDPSAYGIGNQMDYAIESGRDLVSQSKNPITSTIGQTIASPVYDYGQALQKYSDKGYRGEWGLTPQGIMDFAKNVGYVGQEFLDQQPITMMTGRGIGGLKELFGYNDDDETGILDFQLQKNIMNKKAVAQAAMQKKIQQAEAAQAAAAQSAAARQVRQNIQRYGGGDRPDTGMNAPGGGKGQSPTGGNVSGTPFNMGGLARLLYYGGLV
tara:strand:- start:38 stop:733 length:696 start_codon:yes stop_codon:yes gene_type:complete